MDEGLTRQDPAFQGRALLQFPSVAPMSIRRFPHAAAVAAVLTFATGALAQDGGLGIDAGSSIDTTPTITFGPAAILRTTSAQSSVTLVVNDPGGNANGAQVTLTPFPADMALNVCTGSAQCTAIPTQVTLSGTGGTAYLALTVTTLDADYRVGTIRAAV